MKSLLIYLTLVRLFLASAQAAEDPIEKLRALGSNSAVVEGIATMPEDELETLTEYWSARSVLKDASAYQSLPGADIRQLWYGVEKTRIVFELKYDRDRAVDRAIKAIRNVDWMLYRDIRGPELSQLITLSIVASLKIERAIASRWKEIKKPNQALQPTAPSGRG